MRKLSGSEIDAYADDIFEVLKEVPLYYIREVLELGLEFREREGDIPQIDTSSSSEEESDED
jgi:hypothetical protein